MRPFTKSEIISLVIIFAVLILISGPNFVLSIRRARDQVRRDDLGAIQHAMELYLADFQRFPSSSDEKFLACLYPNDKVLVDSKGNITADFHPCAWGKESLKDVTPGSNKVYLPLVPGDPKLQKGISYLYLSDGSRYQIYAYFEGEKDEAGYDAKIVARNLKCGVKICNTGRSYNVPVDISIEEYDQKLLQGK